MKTLLDLLSLRSRTALVTGATGYLGLMISETLAELGSDLIFLDQDKKKIDEFGASLASKYGIKCLGYALDLESFEQRQTFIETVLATTNSLSVLVNNAAFVGTSDLDGWATDFINQSAKTWDRAFQVNLTAPFHLIQGLSSLMKSSPGATIINVTSIYADTGPDWSLYEGTTMANPAAYSASKAGLGQLSRWLASTLSPNVRVNSISPGGIYRSQPKEFVQKYCSKVKLGRMATEEDFKGAIAFLATDLSRYVTGQTLKVDGGWNI